MIYHLQIVFASLLSFLGTHQMLPISGKTGTFLSIAGRDGWSSFVIFQP